MPDEKLAFLFFHEAPEVVERRTFAACVVHGKAAYLACSKLSRRDTYCRRKGNDIALHRAVRFYLTHVNLNGSFGQTRILSRTLEYGLIRLDANEENGFLRDRRSASQAILKVLVEQHGFQLPSARMKNPRNLFAAAASHTEKGKENGK